MSPFSPRSRAIAPPCVYTGPGNALIDWAAQQVTNGRLAYDADGLLAQQGQILTALLERWLALPYFQQLPPKTTGRELFGNQRAEQWWRDAVTAGLSAVDFVATVTEVTAASIAAAYARFAPGPVAQIVVGGGGARNPYLLHRLAFQLERQLERSVALCTHAAFGIDDKAKEALAFALLAYLTIHGWAGNVPTCTGAHDRQILGQIAPGSNYTRLLSTTTAHK